MSRTDPREWLRESKAQGDVIDGLSAFGDWASLWAGCPRGDWLLGIAERLGVDHVALVRAAIACARLASDAEEEGKELLDVALAWTNESASLEDVACATKKLAAQAVMDPATEAAQRAALAVGYGVSDRTILTGAAAAAVESVIMRSIDCGFELALRWAHDKCASAVRTHVPWSLAETCVKRLEDAG